nr:glycerophosphodiester phosphodiesterase family protein [Bradyrhizobium sp. CCBAU 53338]
MTTSRPRTSWSATARRSSASSDRAGTGVATAASPVQIGDCTPLRHPSVRELIADAHKLGLFVHVFTFRNEKKYLAADYQADPVQEYLKFFRLGVDGVFTDFTHTGVAARTAYLRELGW